MSAQGVYTRMGDRLESYVEGSDMPVYPVIKALMRLPEHETVLTVTVAEMQHVAEEYDGSLGDVVKAIEFYMEYQEVFNRQLIIDCYQYR